MYGTVPSQKDLVVSRLFSCSYVDKTSMATSGPGPSKRAKLCSSQSILDYFKPSSTPGPGSDRHASQ